MPRARQASRLGEHTIDQRRTVMGALGSEGGDLAACVGKEDLGVLDALDLDLALLAGAKAR